MLGGNTTAVIQKDFSSTIILGATYSQFANGVKLAVKVVYGEDLERDKITVEVALTAVGDDAKPGERFKLKDPDCAAPTSEVPTCGILLLKKGADGRVTLSVGSCDGLAESLGGCREVDKTEGLVITAIGSLKDSDGDPLYSRKHPAKVILACDEVLCPKTKDVTKFKVFFTLNNTGPLKKVAPPCPEEGELGKGQKVCVDYENSKRRDGDLYLPVLFKDDGRYQRLAQPTNAGSGARTRPSNSRSSSGRPVYAVDLQAASPNSPRLTQLRQRHPGYAQQLQGLARLFGKPLCVGIIVLTCDPCSHSEQESALVRDVG